MLSTIKRELKDNLGDQLRGFHHLIRTLGSGRPEISIAKQPLPPVPPELDRFLGKTFQTMDGVMTTLQSIATPFRHGRATGAGFRDFDGYFGAGNGMQLRNDEALSSDMYAALKRIVEAAGVDRFILKARMGIVCRSLISTSRTEQWRMDDLSECCATLFLALMRDRPIVDTADESDEETWKLYAALSLVFGLAVSGRLEATELQSFAQDAFLFCNLRRDAFLEAARAGSKTDALLKTYGSLLRHLP